VDRPSLNPGDLVEHYAGRCARTGGWSRSSTATTQLGFALLLKFYGRFGRFPRGRGELHDDAVEFVARQLGVEAGAATAPASAV